MKKLICKICGMEKELSEFRSDKRAKLGVVHTCKSCRNAQDAQSGETVRRRYRSVKKRAKRFGVIDTLEFSEYADVFFRRYLRLLRHGVKQRQPQRRPCLSDVGRIRKQSFKHRALLPYMQRQKANYARLRFLPSQR